MSPTYLQDAARFPVVTAGNLEQTSPRGWSYIDLTILCDLCLERAQQCQAPSDEKKVETRNSRDENGRDRAVPVGNRVNAMLSERGQWNCMVAADSCSAQGVGEPGEGARKGLELLQWIYINLYWLMKNEMFNVPF